MNDDDLFSTGRLLDEVEQTARKQRGPTIMTCVARLVEAGAVNIRTEPVELIGEESHRLEWFLNEQTFNHVGTVPVLSLLVENCIARRPAAAGYVQPKKRIRWTFAQNVTPPSYAATYETDKGVASCWVGSDGRVCSTKMLQQHELEYIYNDLKRCGKVPNGL